MARQFSRPSSPLGALVGRIMSRGNRPFNEAHQKARGSGPHRPAHRRDWLRAWRRLAALLGRFPAAEIVGLDGSQRMLAQSRTRNRTAIDTGRLRLRFGGITQLTGPYDLVIAVHVIYFWHDPATTLAQVRSSLTAERVVAMGYRCRQDMPRPAQRDFPREGHRLYHDESEVRDVLSTTGFSNVTCETITAESDTLGWLTTGRA